MIHIGIIYCIEHRRFLRCLLFFFGRVLMEHFIRKELFDNCWHHAPDNHRIKQYQHCTGAHFAPAGLITTRCIHGVGPSSLWSHWGPKPCCLTDDGVDASMITGLLPKFVNFDQSTNKPRPIEVKVMKIVSLIGSFLGGNILPPFYIPRYLAVTAAANASNGNGHKYTIR